MTSEYLPCGTKQMSWLSGLSATMRPISRGNSRVPLAWKARRAESADSRSAPAWWRTGNSSGRGSASTGRIERAPSGGGIGHARAHVVAGGQRVGAELARGLQQVGELDGLVARDAGDRRLAGHVALRERIDHRLAEALFVVEHVVRNAERLGDAARIVDVLAGAARALAVSRRRHGRRAAASCRRRHSPRASAGRRRRRNRRRPTWRRRRGFLPVYRADRGS